MMHIYTLISHFITSLFILHTILGAYINAQGWTLQLEGEMLQDKRAKYEEKKPRGYKEEASKGSKSMKERWITNFCDHTHPFFAYVLVI